MIELERYCDTCKNYLGNDKSLITSNSGASFCKAYPNGIPHIILAGVEKHTTPYPGDNGIQYEPIEENK